MPSHKSEAAAGAPAPKSVAECVLAALSYMTCAVLLLVFNKAALTGYRFPYPNIVTLLQLICSLVILALLGSLGVISFTTEEAAQIGKPSRFVSVHTLRASLPLSMAFLFFLTMGMYSIGGVSLPMYTTLRRTTVAFTMTIEYFTSSKMHPPRIVASVGLIVLGAAIAGANDLSFNAWGYFLVFLANVSTALYLITVASIGQKTPLNSFGMMWSNGVVCAPILLAYTHFSGELAGCLRYEHLREPAFGALMAASAVLAFALNYTIFWNTSINSALTQNVCGNLKDFVTIVLGYCLVDLIEKVPLDIYNFTGISAGMIGSCFYAYVKLGQIREANEAAKQRDAEQGK